MDTKQEAEDNPSQDQISPGSDRIGVTESSGSTSAEREKSNREQTNTQTDAETLSLDLIFDVLKNERRRRVIRYLRDYESQVSLSDLAEHIAALENDTEVASITSSQRKRVYVGLYQCHLPKMADMEIIEFNQDRGIIELGEKAPQLYRYLDNETAQPQETHWYYLAIGVAGFVATMLSLLLIQTTVVPIALTSFTMAIAVLGYSANELRKIRGQEQ